MNLQQFVNLASFMLAAVFTALYECRRGLATTILPIGFSDGTRLTRSISTGWPKINGTIFLCTP